MEAKKLFFMEGGMNMDKLIDIAMTKLFQLAEYVCSKCSPEVDEPIASRKVVPTISFTNVAKAEIMRGNSDACVRSFERKQFRLKIKVVEGELFK